MGRSIKQVVELDDEIVNAIEQKMGVLVTNMTSTLKDELSTSLRTIVAKSIGYEQVAYTKKMGDEKKYQELRVRDEKMLQAQREQHLDSINNSERQSLESQQIILEQTQVMLNQYKYEAERAGDEGRAEYMSDQGIKIDTKLKGINIELIGANIYEDYELDLLDADRAEEAYKDIDKWFVDDNNELTEEGYNLTEWVQEHVDDINNGQPSSAEETEEANQVQKVDVIPTSIKGIGLAVGTAVFFALSGAMKVGAYAQGVSNRAALYDTMNIDSIKAQQIDTAFKNIGMDNTLGELIGTLRQVMPDAGVSDLLDISKQYNSMDAGPGRDSYLKTMGFGVDQGLAVSRFGEVLSASNNIQFNKEDLAAQKEIAKAFTELNKSISDLTVSLVTGFAPAIIDAINAMTKFVEFIHENTDNVVKGSKLGIKTAVESNPLLYMMYNMNKAVIDNFTTDEEIKSGMVHGSNPSTLLTGSGTYYNMGNVTVIANNPEEFTEAIKNETNHIKNGE